MSRIGKLPIAIPDKVKIAVDGRTVRIEGPKGKLEMPLPKRTEIKVDEGKIVLSRDADDSEAKAMHGLGRALLANMVEGVSQGFSKKLEIQGVGFKAAVQGQTVNLSLGYSHPINYDIPTGVSVKVEGGTAILVEGPDKQKVGQVAADIRGFYPPEPYKGKGVRYSDEKVLRKEGKSVQ